MIKDGIRFRVLDAKSNKDITHTILLQILTDLETSQSEVLTVDLLRNLLGFYRDPTHAQVGRYLEHCLALYKDYQISLKSPVNSILPLSKQASHLHDAAEDALEKYLKDQEK
jgi:polyhydroxyalkanoate synthesis repressor PhaR